MKKIALLLAASLIVIGAIGCGAKEDPAATGSTGTTASTGTTGANEEKKADETKTD